MDHGGLPYLDIPESFHRSRQARLLNLSIILGILPESAALRIRDMSE
jgi:hypothetical protein